MTNIHLKDGQEPPRQIHYKLGNFRDWKFNGFVENSTEYAYRKRLTKKSSVMFCDGRNNSLLDMYAKKEGHIYPRGEHMVAVYGYTVMPVIWKPSGRIKFARYISIDEIPFKYLKKIYPSGTWMSGKSPDWVRGKK